MADRQVTVRLKADVGAYVSDVRAATAATRALQQRAERFDGRKYRASLDVDTASAESKIRRANTELRALGSSIAAFGPGAVALGSAAGAGLLGLAAALGVVAAAAGTSVAAFQGVGDATKALREFELDPTAANLEKVREAMGNLTAEGQRFARFLDGEVRPALRELRNTAQAGMLPGVQDGLREVMGLLPQVNSLVGETSRVLGDLARESGRGFNTPAVRQYLAHLENRARPVLSALVRSTMDVGAGIAGMLRGLDVALGDDVLRSVERLSVSFASWGTNLRFSSGLQEFGDYAREIGPQVADTLGAIGRALLAVAVAAAPISGPVLAAIRGLAGAVEAIAESGAGTPLLAIATGLGAINLALRGAQALRSAPVFAMLGGLAGSAGAAGGATGRLAGALRGLGPAALAAGIAAVGISVAYDQIKTKAEEGAEAVARGSTTTRQVFDEELSRLRSRTQVLNDMQGPGFAAGQAVGEMTGLIDANARSLREEEEALRLTLEGQRRYLEGLPPLERATAALAIAQSNYLDALDRFKAGSPQAVAAQAAVEAAARGVEAAERAAADATKSHADRMAERGQGFLAVRAAEDGFAAAVRGSTVSIAENGRTLDINTVQGQNNRRALDEMARAAWADINAKREHGYSTGEITRLTEGHRVQLFNTARQMGLSEGAARAYVDQIGLVPESQTTVFLTPGLREAIRGVSDLRDRINELQDFGRARLTGAVTDALDATRRRVRGYATGGQVSGPGTATSDSVPAWLSVGEHVLTAREVRAFGGHRRVEEMREAAVSSRGYARGGPVKHVELDFRGAAEAAGRITSEMFPPVPAPGGGGSVERWRPLVLAALARQGFPAYHADRVLMQIRTESGGNPNAINLWDINAKRGYPSRGLLQTIPQTFAAYRDPGLVNNIVDPFANINASLRYARARYGSLERAYRGVGYHDGGRIPGTDEGMILAQGGERVLSRAQTSAFDRLVDVLDRPTPISPSIVGRVRGGDGGTTVTNTFGDLHFRETVDLDLFNSRLDFATSAERF